MSRPLFIEADWINLEGRLTAFFSQDETLQSMLDEELTGGYKVHARTAGLLYNIDPGDAKKHKVNLQGKMVDAYEGGKRVRHGWHYGMKEKKMAETFWVPMGQARHINTVLSDLHPRIPLWWKELGDEVFGVARYGCPICEHQQATATECEVCTDPLAKYVPRCRYIGWETEPTRVLYTPFGRRRIYLGRRPESMNAVIAQKPQGSGASMWYNRLGALHGLDDHPVPPETIVFDGSYSSIVTPSHNMTSVVTGTYDSFLVQTLDTRLDIMLQWMAWTLERAWPQLGGLRIPVEIKVGENWGRVTSKNKYGLTPVAYTPFSATCPKELR